MMQCVAQDGKFSTRHTMSLANLGSITASGFHSLDTRNDSRRMLRSAKKPRRYLARVVKQAAAVQTKRRDVKSGALADFDGTDLTELIFGGEMMPFPELGQSLSPVSLTIAQLF